ncbi:uncharacterized protein LOC106665012 [Cimex lectularius]|uniref:Protein sleepless n=1 Tax=Cimex lectularius TaxID=79782 RepID=A0A8I6RR40_CIMLE|nr:uncharacterized protein LOC106665012 [Cimex lectularius]
MRFLLLFCATACFVPLGLGIKCYKCTSDNSDFCGDKFDAKKATVENCPTRNAHETCGYVEFEHNNKLATHRDCGGPYNDCNILLSSLSQTYHINSLTACKFCTGDLCNSATNLQVTGPIIFAVLSTVYMFL